MTRQSLPKVSWQKPAVPVPDVPEVPASTETIGQVRAKNPPTFKRPPVSGTWAERFDAQEARVEQQEAELALKQRTDELKAVEEELMTRAVNRRLALGFGAVGVRFLGTLDLVSKELDRRVKDEIMDMSNKELRETVQVLGTALKNSQGAIEASAKAERYMTRHPLAVSAVDQDDLDNLNPEEAMTILKNLAGSIQNITKKYIPAEGESVE